MRIDADVRLLPVLIAAFAVIISLAALAGYCRCHLRIAHNLAESRRLLNAASLMTYRLLIRQYRPVDAADVENAMTLYLRCNEYWSSTQRGLLLYGQGEQVIVLDLIRGYLGSQIQGLCDGDAVIEMTEFFRWIDESVQDRRYPNVLSQSEVYQRTLRITERYFDLCLLLENLSNNFSLG
jgi:hypothetical protein